MSRDIDSSRYCNKRKLAFHPGDVTYLQLDFTGTVKDKTIAWKIDQREAMPREFVSRPLVLVHDGKWQMGVVP